MEDNTHSSIIDNAHGDESLHQNDSSSSSVMANSTDSVLAPPRLSRNSSSASVNAISKKFPQSSFNPSPRASRDASRETSPARTNLRASSTAGRRSAHSRSRHSSKADISPPRSASASGTNPPSAAAIQRALSSATIPNLPQPEVLIRAPTPQRVAPTTEGRDSPRWPVSPRLRSPPPVTKSSVVSPRKMEEQPLTHRAVVAAAFAQERANVTDSDEELVPTSRVPSRTAIHANAPLETVQETGLLSTPDETDDHDGKPSNDEQRRLEEFENTLESAATRAVKMQAAAANDSGSDSGGKSDSKKRPSSTPATTNSLRPATLPPKPNSSSATPRAKTGSDGAAKTMTLETETVSSIPQVAVGGAGPANGSLRAKPSSETIRPKKEKKRPRKAPSVSAGTASSKADIFEAKIASAVDEANSSDSDETFVYESNPPDDRPRRYHSRTPSATSMASQADQRTSRSMLAMLDSGHSVVMKKSMKFVNPYNGGNGADTGAADDEGKGTIRSSTGTGRGTAHHHHIGRWGRHGNGHPSLFDNESPFSSTKTKAGSNNTRTSSRPSSPRFMSQSRLMGSKKAPSAYDLDDTTGADDERTPLLTSTIRTHRMGRARRGTSLRQMEHHAARQQRSFLTRFAGCLVFTVMIILVMSGAIGFLFASTTPLIGVKVLALKHVLASQQELMLDMVVSAQNPNVVAISVDSMDMEVFARSTHLDDDNDDWWRKFGDFSKRRQTSQSLRERDSLSPPIFPPGDDPEGAQTIKLGTITAFDSPLYFEGSPFRRVMAESIGEVRLSKPGNHSDSGGYEQWQKVLQYDFELILRGVLKYNLPLTNRIHSVSVSGHTTVKKAQPDDPVKHLELDGIDLQVE